jgi:hypothetical protein
MNTKIYLTIVAVLAVIYALAFILIPDSMAELYGVKMPQPNAVLNIQFFGSALLSIGIIAWFARESGDWATVRGILIGSAIGDAVGCIISVWGTIQGLTNALGWSSAILYALLVLGAIYCLSTGGKSFKAA